MNNDICNMLYVIWGKKPKKPIGLFSVSFLTAKRDSLFQFFEVNKPDYSDPKKGRRPHSKFGFYF